MPEQALYLKWRPLSFDEVVGQEHVTRTLRNSLKAGRIRHAYLFSGPRGTGKTTMARLLAKAVNCHNDDPDTHPCNECPACIAVNEGRYLDLIEIDAATHTGVDDVRDLRDKIAFTPGEGRYKVYIIDEVHRFTGNAFDALLKTLEEPPDHAIFVLATTEIDRVPATIKSRCLQFEFRRLSLQELANRLEQIADAEGLNVEHAALELIARQSTGSVRDSISLLDQIVSDPSEALTLELVQRILGTANTLAVREMVEAVVSADAARGLHVINAAVDSGSDPRQFGQQVVEHLRAVLLTQTAGADLIEASQEDRAMYQEQAADISGNMLLRAIRAFNEAVNAYTGGWQPQLALELALIESMHEPEPEYAAPPPQQPATSPPQGASTPDQKVDDQNLVKEIEPTTPGTPPIISAETIRKKWMDVQKTAYRYNRNLPPLLEHVHVRFVDGNRLVLGVQNEMFLQKLTDETRLKRIRQVLFDVHQVDLLIEVTLVDSAGEPQDEDAEIDDPLLKEVLDLGGQITEPTEPDEE